MADRSKELIEELTDTIFRNLREREHRVLNQRLTDHLNDHAKRNVIASGMFNSGVGRLHGEFLQRVLEQCLDELLLAFRQAGRQDGTFFWNVVDAKLKLLSDSIRTSLNNTAIDYCQRHGGLSGTGASIVAQGFSQFGDNAHHLISSRVQELRLRSQFISMKSPADRKASQIPDVAVMMWFPSADAGAEVVARASAKYEAIKAAVHEASNGLATVDKIDNPSLVHKDRISPSVENWLEKAVLVICDLEGNRPNVFYEFGYTRAVGTDLIATRPAGQKTDFHLAQWNIDEYTDLDELKLKFTPRIATVLSRYDLSGST